VTDVRATWPVLTDSSGASSVFGRLRLRLRLSSHEHCAQAMRAAGLRLRPGLRPPALRPAPLRQHCACRCASTMQVFETVGSYRDFRASLPGGGGGGVGLVATMGYLHDGHLSLARHARAENETVVATIFVNPMQFAAHEDLDTYPRDSERDLALLESVGVDAVLMPPRDEVYDAGAHSRQRPGPARPGLLQRALTPRRRPQHRRGPGPGL